MCICILSIVSIEQCFKLSSCYSLLLKKKLCRLVKNIHILLQNLISLPVTLVNDLLNLLIYGGGYLFAVWLGMSKIFPEEYLLLIIALIVDKSKIFGHSILRNHGSCA